MLRLKSNAKINLSLRVADRLENGYHEVEMIMQSIGLYDILTISSIEEDRIITSTGSDMVPDDGGNLAYKAAELIKREYNIDKGVKIEIEKNIPVAAGMAGGSSNAAAVLVGLDRLWNLGIGTEKLKSLGVSLGADVPFCIEGGCMLSTGIGEILENTEPLSDKFDIVVCKPEFSISTAEAYAWVDNLLEKRKKSLVIEKNSINTYEVQKAISNSDLEKMRNFSGNDLDGFAKNNHPEINNIVNTMYEYGSGFSMMTGSGPTVYGIFENNEKAKKCFKALKSHYNDTFIISSVSKGVEFFE